MQVKDLAKSSPVPIAGQTTLPGASEFDVIDVAITEIWKTVLVRESE